MKAVSICIAMVLCWVCTVHAQLYKWVDENGVTHFSNIRPSKMEQVETSKELKNHPSYNHNDGGLGKLLNSYRRDSSEQNNTVPLKNESTYSKPLSKDWIEYYELQIKQRQSTVNNYSDDLKDVKRTPHKDYRSHKKRLRYHESRLESARLDLEKAQREYEDYKNSQ